MDVHVVSNCWWRDGATVIGCGAEMDDAKVIADRTDLSGQSPEVVAWGPWKPWETDPATIHRDALTAAGTVHSSLYQEIVTVPLAGGTPWSDPNHDMIGDVRAMAARIQSEHHAEIAEIGRSFGAP